MFCDWSLISASFFLVTAVVVLVLKVNYLLVIGLTCVGIVSLFHHRRNYTQSYNDPLKYIDQFFAVLLGIIIIYIFGWTSLLYLVPAVILYIIVTFSYIDPCTKSILHMVLHIIINVGVVVQAVMYNKNKKL